MVGKQLYCDRSLGCEMVLRNQFARRLIEQVSGVRCNYVAFLCVDLDQKCFMFRRAIIFHRVQQVERILGPEVVRIALE